MRWLDGITDSMHMSLSRLRELVINREAWRAVVHRVTNTQTQLRLYRTEILLEMNVLRVRGKREHEIAFLLTGKQMVSITETLCQMYS